MRLPSIVAVAILTIGCPSTSAKAPFEDVSRTVTASTGHTVRWNQGTEDDRAAEQAVERLLAKDLDANSAVQVALLANPSPCSRS